MTLVIKNIIDTPFAVSSKDGDKVFELINSSLNNRERIEVDFIGIHLVITAFLNAAIGKLYLRHDHQLIKESLEIKNMSDSEIELLGLVIENAKARFHENQDEK